MNLQDQVAVRVWWGLTSRAKPASRRLSSGLKSSTTNTSPDTVYIEIELAWSKICSFRVEYQTSHNVMKILQFAHSKKSNIKFQELSVTRVLPSPAASISALATPSGALKSLITCKNQRDTLHSDISWCIQLNEHIHNQENNLKF